VRGGKALADPLAVALLGGSVALAALAVARGPWPAPLPIILTGWGVLGYAGVVAVGLWEQARPPSASRLATRPGATRDVRAEGSDPFPAGLTAGEGDVTASAAALAHLLEEALRNLNKPANLASCGLVARLPRTLATTRAQRGGAQLAAATPLERAQALREVLVTAIERLKPPDGAGAEQALQYHIFHEEYILGLATKQIQLRHAISASTFHRHRHHALLALAQEIMQHEAFLAAELAPSP